VRQGGHTLGPVSSVPCLATMRCWGSASWRTERRADDGSEKDFKRLVRARIRKTASRTPPPARSLMPVRMRANLRRSRSRFLIVSVLKRETSNARPDSFVRRARGCSLSKRAAMSPCFQSSDRPSCGPLHSTSANVPPRLTVPMSVRWDAAPRDGARIDELPKFRMRTVRARVAEFARHLDHRSPETHAREESLRSDGDSGQARGPPGAGQSGRNGTRNAPIAIVRSANTSPASPK
jgi:hypothetical protein